MRLHTSAYRHLRHCLCKISAVNKSASLLFLLLLLQSGFAAASNAPKAKRTRTPTPTPTPIPSPTPIVTATPTQTSSPTPSPTSTPIGATIAYPRGIYWLMSVGNDAGLSTAMTQSYVDGATLRYRWASLESADGVYNWTMLDNDLAAIASAGKHAIILMAAGRQSPCWLKNEGAPVYNDYNTFDSYCSNYPSATFKTADSQNGDVVPLPWDTTYFQSKFDAFINALGSHISATGKMGVIAGVVAVGVAHNTSEVGLCTTGANPGCSDTVGWANVGYTRANVREAYRHFLNSWSGAFPNVSMSSRFLQGQFPSGFAPCGGTVDRLFPRELADIAYANYGDQAIFGYNGLDDSVTSSNPGNSLLPMCSMLVPSSNLWMDCENSAESCQLGADYNTFQGADYIPYVMLEGLQEVGPLGDGKFAQAWTNASASFSRLLFIEVYPGDFPTNAGGSSDNNLTSLIDAHNVLTSDGVIPTPTATP